MAARAIASGTISFGLVSVPIKLFSTSESKSSISFNWLHTKCGSRLKQQYWCPQEEVVVTKDEMINGYEFSKGQYVTFAPEELKALDGPIRDQYEVDRLGLDRAAGGAGLDLAVAADAAELGESKDLGRVP